MRFVPAIILTIPAGMNSVMNTDCILLLRLTSNLMVWDMRKNHSLSSLSISRLTSSAMKVM
ncbi:Uncharacterised protein [Segatella copri]|nr:Uncharacterised protein [Segatella copri]